MLAEIRFCLFWVPFEIITHESILPFSIEILHRYNAQAHRRIFRSEAEANPSGAAPCWA
jgi:hypothetical protein